MKKNFMKKQWMNYFKGEKRMNNEETDLQKANDSKFTLNAIIFMTVILILSSMIFYIFGF